MMKKLILVSASLLAFSLIGHAWGRQGHATVAKIAEDHLTATTKKALSEYLNGESIVTFASYADEYKGALPYDYGFVGEDGQQVRSYPHTFEVDMNFKPFPTCNDNGRFVKNCLWFVEQYGNDLKEGARDMDDSTRFVKIVMIVHWLGDMHCPEHIRYNPEDMTIGYFDVIYNKEKLRYHTFWDRECITVRYPWSFSDIAYLCDTATDKEMEEIIAGDVWDWAEDAARASWPIHDKKAGDKLTGAWVSEQMPLVRSQLRNAGYRLAKTLNMIFDPKYAKKNSVK